MAAADFPNLPIPEALRGEAQEACDRIAEGHPEVIAAHGETLLRLFAASPYAATVGVAQPEYLPELIANPTAVQVLENAEDEDFPSRIRRARNRELLRIAYCDIFGLADTEQTLKDSSAFSAAAIVAAYAHAVAHTTAQAPKGADGEPIPLLIVGLGKLGGGELNFSSDIDLIFSYPTPESGRDEAQMYFTRMCQKLIKTLHDVTADGFVARVDMRLRPFGSSGALALPIDAMHSYYQSHGREWERYALLKGRILNPDRTGTDELLSVFQPFVFRRNIDFRVFEELRAMKVKMEHNVNDAELVRDVKHGPGGIREAEFIVQSHQMIFGGKQPELQVTGWHDALSALVATHHLKPEIADELRTAYDYLRRVENHLQMARDQQVHVLPEHEEDRERLRYSLGYASWEEFESELQTQRDAMHKEFTVLMHAEDEQPGETAAAPEDLLTAALVHPEQRTPEHLIEVLQTMGIDEAAQPVEDLLAMIERPQWQTQQSADLHRTHTLVSGMVAAAAHAATAAAAVADGATILCRMLRVLETLLRQPSHIALLTENPHVLKMLAEVASRSTRVLAQIEQSPNLLDELLDPESLFAEVTQESLETQLAILRGKDGGNVDDLELQMQHLRNFRKSQVLRVAVNHVLGSKSISDISDELGWIAEITTRVAWEIAEAEQVHLYGEPYCVDAGTRRRPGTIVLAYGKLGGLELGFSSDLDLVFVHNAAGDEQATEGEPSKPYEYFVTRQAQRFTHIMECTTAEGQLYEVDTRLRPDGTAGQLVCSLAYYRKYLEERALLWEHQSLIRARPVAGDPELIAAFEQLRSDILCRPRDAKEMQKEFLAMREKMLETNRPVKDRFALKTDRDGVTDIEFLVHYNVLLHAAEHPELIKTTPTIQILDRFSECGLFDTEDVEGLRACYFAFRDRIHELSLQDEVSSVSDAEYPVERELVRALWDRTFNTSS